MSPRWNVQIADLYTREVEAETEADAIAAAKDDSPGYTMGTLEYDGQRCLHVERLREED